MRDARDIIIRPIVSEKSMDGAELKKYSFEVNPKANKIEIANAIEEIFDVDVDKVNTMNVRGKVKRRGMSVGRRKNWKKAVVTLTEDSRDIEIFTN